MASMNPEPKGLESKPFPPGPPIVGNLLHFSFRGAWTQLPEYKSKYSDLIFFHGLGTNIRVLVLNSLQTINDLFKKRLMIYSHRPSLTVAGDLVGLNQSTAFQPYGKEWRENRRMAYLALSPKATRKYHTIQEDILTLLNQALLDNPTDFIAHVRLTAARIVLSVTYGLSVSKADRDVRRHLYLFPPGLELTHLQYIQHAEKTMDIVGKAIIPGAYLCDLLPFFKYSPSWVPFKQEAAHGEQMIQHLIMMPFKHVKRSMVRIPSSIK
ncbi:hypothetical protein DXG01_003520 [Tephrocybe rancida]|nr:hypothetical protein DXG01_003520 [Tephrocybe rancida]